ncbi:Glycosyltransferase involved in cell wall bisynthesis [Planctomycetales bacterium 10988]|nr:Glycosyltransferase involved in cell wall bisynthesis [Planctomycetales bacterium 10988]
MGFVVRFYRQLSDFLVSICNQDRRANGKEPTASEGIRNLHSNPQPSSFVEETELPEARVLGGEEEALSPFYLILPLTKNSTKNFQAVAKSLMRQEYPHWSLSILYDESLEAELVESLIELTDRDSRIQAIEVKAPQTIQGSLHLPRDQEKDGFVGVILDEKTFSVDALSRAAEAIQAQPEIEEIFFDPESNQIGLHLSDGNPTAHRLLGYDYSENFALVRVSLLREVGGFRPRLEDQIFIPEPLPSVNWFDDGEISEQLDAWGLSWELPKSTFEKQPKSELEATRFILSILREYEDLRARFPLALSEGKSGAFCTWLCGEGLSRFGLPDEARQTIREVFVQYPGGTVRQVMTFRKDVRTAYPTALLPTGLRSFLQWLLKWGKAEYSFSDEAIWWFCLEAAEDPLREITYSYQINPQWQEAFPAALSAIGQEPFLQWLKTKHRLNDPLLQAIRKRTQPLSLDDLRIAYWSLPHWQSKFPRAFQSEFETQELMAWVASHTAERSDSGYSAFPKIHQNPSNQLGLNLIGHFCYASGLQQSARSIVHALQRVNVPVGLRDAPVHHFIDHPKRRDYLAFEPHQATLIHVQPVLHKDHEYCQAIYSSAGLIPRPDLYRIGYWYWELERVPEPWKSAAKTVDELWAPTTFVADAMRNSLPNLVTPMLPGIELGEVELIDREELGIEADQYFFLFMFDMKSVMERKNPLGLIEAYRKAFAPDDRVTLLIKVSSGDFNPPELARLKQAAKEAGVRIWDKVLDRKRSYGLIQACDCYISLHRSEGFGLTMAEAMLLAKPVIATNYSGNRDFMDGSSSMLADYRLQDLAGNCPEYVYSVYSPENSWALPDVEHAAYWMRWAYQHQEEAKSLGLRGQAHARQVLSPDKAGERLKSRLQAIYHSLKEKDYNTPQRRAS